jgi:hypothetical protein
MKFLVGKRAFIAVALKELLHLWRDRRILMLVIFLPPVFTLLPQVGNNHRQGPAYPVRLPRFRNFLLESESSRRHFL